MDALYCTDEGDSDRGLPDRSLLVDRTVPYQCPPHLLRDSL